MNVLMVSAENDGIGDKKKPAKVGGIGDVVRDVPPALARLHHQISTVIPSYGFLHKIEGAKRIKNTQVNFFGTKHDMEIFEAPGKIPFPGVKHYVLHHPRFESRDKNGKFEIYHPDPVQRPFATDATKYALFCLAVAEVVKRKYIGSFDCIHLHDWHAAHFLFLRKYHPDYESLRRIKPVVYTIHNLALQGIRPFDNDESSLNAWYPNVKYNREELEDPRWHECENPMKIGIRLADAVHTVSPSYANEILQSSNEKLGYYGGEGLEEFLLQAKNGGRLFGILNGCEYPTNRTILTFPDFPEFINFLKTHVVKWIGSSSNLSATHFMAYARLTELDRLANKNSMILTSVSRITDQKTLLLKNKSSRNKSGLQEILENLKGKGIYVFLGSGNEEDERFFTEMSSHYEHFVFLKGYSEDCANALYANGDLFLMPSSFEPCGISQMLAMRDGQPCVVHEVGGLKDTVKDGVNGFTFGGTSILDQVDNFVKACNTAIAVKLGDPVKWKNFCAMAAEERFLWATTVNEYVNKLYTRAPAKTILSGRIFSGKQ